jgi:hypothetical protein
MYYSDSTAGAYLSTPAGVDTVTAIGTYMLKVPTDPGTITDYTWIANASDLQKYCVYAVLENETAWIAASEAGVIKRATVPTGLGTLCR